MYFDAVLDADCIPVFTGTEDEVVEWLQKNTWASNLEVCVGRTLRMVPVPKYLAAADL